VHMLQDTPENHLAPLTSQLALTDAEKQRKRMLIALGILLAALVAVVLKDFDFWFPPDGEVQEAVVRYKNKKTKWSGSCNSSSGCCSGAQISEGPSGGDRDSKSSIICDCGARRIASYANRGCCR